MTAPLTDTIVIAVSRLVDDAGATRQPSHSDIQFQIRRAGLELADPSNSGPPVGKAKRVRGTLSWALEHEPNRGAALVASLIALIRGCGGFRRSSLNFIGEDVIKTAIDAFRGEGYELSFDGELRPLLLDSLSGAALTEALYSYVRRAKRGADDAALVTGTGKDLLEATAAHILTEQFGVRPQIQNFPTLLGQAFLALGLATPHSQVAKDELPQRRLERAMYELACSINTLRNKTGTGHGRPWLPSVSTSEARTAIEFMGNVAEALLTRLRPPPP